MKIETDSEARSTYIYLNQKSKVANTIAAPEGSSWCIDLDEEGRVIGIGLLGYVVGNVANKAHRSLKS